MTRESSPDVPQAKPPDEPANTRPAVAALSEVVLAIESRPSPTRSQAKRSSMALIFGSCAVALGVFFAAGGVRTTGRPIPLVLGTAIGTGALAAAAIIVGLRRGRSSLGRTPSIALSLTMCAPAMIVAWKLFWSSQYEHALGPWATRPGLKCLALSLSIGFCPLVAFAIGRRSSDPRKPVVTGVVAGLAVGAATNVLTDLWCPVAYLPHLLLGHMLPVVLLASLGGLLGSRLVRLS